MGVKNSELGVKTMFVFIFMFGHMIFRGGGHGGADELQGGPCPPGPPLVTPLV